MKKPIAMLLGLVLISAISMAIIGPAKAGISMADWRPTYISKNSGGVIYKDGETASLLVSVQNDISPGYKMNISQIVINFFEVGKNKTLDLLANPYQLLYGQTGIFTVSFPASQADFYSGLQFDYRIIIEWVNATTGPMRVVSFWNYGRGIVNFQPLFQVYPTAQADAAISLSKYYAYYNTYGTGYWNSVLGRQKANQAIIEKSLGDQYLTSDNYASALTKYDQANTLWEEALVAENDYRTQWNNADLNETLTHNAVNMAEANAFKTEADAHLIEANAAKTQADAALTNAYGWYFIGIGFALGWTLMGVGAIIWAWRRPKPPV